MQSSQSQVYNLEKSSIIGFYYQAIVIEVLSGEIWLTLQGDNKDYILSPKSGMIELPMNSHLVIEALSNCLMHISSHHSGHEICVRKELHLETGASIDEAESTRPSAR